MSEARHRGYPNRDTNHNRSSQEKTNNRPNQDRGRSDVNHQRNIDTENRRNKGIDQSPRHKNQRGMESSHRRGGDPSPRRNRDDRDRSSDDYNQHRGNDSNKQVRLREDDCDDNYDDERPRQNSMQANQSAEDRKKEARGRWKDAGEEHIKKERRRARQEHMARVMKLFEDSLLTDSVPSWRERQRHMEDVRLRLDELKKDFSQRRKSQVATQWQKVAKDPDKDKNKDRESKKGPLEPVGTGWKVHDTYDSS